MIFTDWLNVINDSWLSIWDRFIAFLPNLIAAGVVLVIGWLVGMLVALLIDRLFRIVGLQTLFEKAKVDEVINKSGIEKDSTSLLSAVAKWIIYLVAFIASANILKLPDVANFLDRILAYVPSVIAAIAILLIGFVLANFLAAVVKSSIKASGMASAEAMSLIVRYSVGIFAFLAAIAQLGIAANLINTFFIGLVALLAIAGGLAFGLGGKEAAQEWIEKIRKELK